MKCLVSRAVCSCYWDYPTTTTTKLLSQFAPSFFSSSCFCDSFVGVCYLCILYSTELTVFFSLPCQTSPWVWGKLDPFLGCGRWGWEFSIFVQVFLGGRVTYSTIQFVCRLPLREISDLLLAATDGGHIEIILYLGKGQKASQQASSLTNLKREAVSPVRDRVVISTIQFESHWQTSVCFGGHWRTGGVVMA